MKKQGQTLFVATGDTESKTPAHVTWPSDDPWVTAVGGTVLVTTGPGGSWKSETGWAGSAGMPSKNRVPIPEYQKLTGVINSSNKGSKTLRNIPDVALNATNYYTCANNSCSVQYEGTSYAAPLWAGFMALVNQQAAQKGVKPIGFLNPIIYPIGLGSTYNLYFHDITSGSNGTYSAVKGYDLVTGWGSFIGPALINKLTSP